MKYASMILGLLLVGMVPVGASAQTGETSPENSGTRKFLLTGYGTANFVIPKEEPSTFSAGFNPVFLWKLSDHMLFEAEVEFELEEGTTETGLEYAQLWYTTSGPIMFGAGKYLNPSNMFIERLHPTWINKLPDIPLGLSGHGGVQLLAGTQIGAQARGALPISSAMLTYAAYISNGPALNTEEPPPDEMEEHEHGAGPPGSLNFNNTPDNNDNKAVGGRIAFLPVPELELGYGIESGKASGEDSVFKDEDVPYLNNVVDLTYVGNIQLIRGKLDIRGQYVWLNVDNPNIAPLDFENDSRAGFGQVAYRPDQSGSPVVSRFEIVARYDEERLPDGAPESVDLTRWTGGLNFWIAPTSVLKVAYENLTSKHEGEEETEYLWTGQFAMGF